MDHHAGRLRKHRIGRWMPHQDALEDWLEGLVKDIRARRGAAKLHTAVEGLRELIEGDPVVRLLLTEMIEQVPHARPYTRRHLESVDQMLTLIDEVIGRAPEYLEAGHVGVPLNAVLDWCMGTPAGFAAFSDESADEFVGGSVYQAYLDAHNYHRWHSLVSGTIRKAFVREGALLLGGRVGGQRLRRREEVPWGIWAHVATRAIVLIQADDSTIGLVCLMPVGMGEVSSCVIHPEVRQGPTREEGRRGRLLPVWRIDSTARIVLAPSAVGGLAPEALPQVDNPDPPPVLLGAKISTANSR